MFDSIRIFVKNPSGQTSFALLPSSPNLDDRIRHIWNAALGCSITTRSAYLVHEGRVLESSNYHLLKEGSTVSIQLRLLGGIDRQNREIGRAHV